MFLFLIGVGGEVVSFLLFFLIVFGLVSFWGSWKILRRILKDASSRKINALSIVLSVFLAPILLAGAFSMLLLLLSIV